MPKVQSIFMPMASFYSVVAECTPTLVSYITNKSHYFLTGTGQEGTHESAKIYWCDEKNNQGYIPSSKSINDLSDLFFSYRERKKCSRNDNCLPKEQ